MRNFDERKAEIFRRSENRIKERKRNRNRILALCVPLCLCIAILSVIYLPEMLISSDKSNYVEYETNMQYSDGASTFAYTSVEIKTNTATASSGSSSKKNDIEDVKNIYNIIQSSLATADEQDDAYDQFVDAQKGEVAGKGENNKGPSSSETTTYATKDLSYTITFSSDDGTQVIYVLDGNKLIDKATKQQATLTDGQLIELQKALGLTITYTEEEAE